MKAGHVFPKMLVVVLKKLPEYSPLRSRDEHAGGHAGIGIHGARRLRVAHDIERKAVILDAYLSRKPREQIFFHFVKPEIGGAEEIGEGNDPDVGARTADRHD